MNEDFDEDGLTYEERQKAQAKEIKAIGVKFQQQGASLFQDTEHNRD